MEKIKLVFNYSIFRSDLYTIESDTIFPSDIMDRNFRLTIYHKKFNNKELKLQYKEQKIDMESFKKDADSIVIKKEQCSKFSIALSELILNYFEFYFINRSNNNVLFRAEIEMENEKTKQYEFLLDIIEDKYWTLNICSHPKSQYELEKTIKFCTNKFYMEIEYFTNFSNKLDIEIVKYLKEKRVITLEYFKETYFPDKPKDIFENIQKVCKSLYLFDVKKSNAKQIYNNLCRLNKIAQILLKNKLLPKMNNYQDLMYQLEYLIFIANKSIFGDGAYYNRTNSIAIYNIDCEDELEFLEHTLIHEFGHYIDFYLKNRQKESYLQIREKQLNKILISDYGQSLIKTKENAISNKERSNAKYLSKDTELIAENYFGLIIKNKLIENSEYHENNQLKRYLNFSPKYIHNLCLNEYQKYIQDLLK